MTIDLDALEAVFDEADYGEFDESDEAVSRPAVRTPSRRSSFLPRAAPAVASQGQVQAAARTLDQKIDTLSSAVKALETRTNSVAARAERTAGTLAREVVQRKKAEDSIRADVQQTKMLTVLLPLLNQSTVPAVDSAGVSHEVLTQTSGGINSLLPLLLILPGATSGDGSKGAFGGDILTTLLLFKVIGK